MWKCRHCEGLFDFTRTTDKANHSRHCKSNPKRKSTYEQVGKANRRRWDNELGEKKRFSVKCHCCGCLFDVFEREKCFPKKEKYFCSRKCANGTGGKAKADKYGVIGYYVIAKRYYKRQCAVCGTSDVLDVHHIDGNRKNYHPSNLIFLCPNDHARLHRNNDKTVKKVIEGHGTAWSGHFTCNEDISGVRLPDAPPDYFLKQIMESVS